MNRNSFSIFTANRIYKLPFLIVLYKKKLMKKSYKPYRSEQLNYKRNQFCLWWTKYNVRTRIFLAIVRSYKVKFMRLRRGQRERSYQLSYFPLFHSLLKSSALIKYHLSFVYDSLSCQTKMWRCCELREMLKSIKSIT